MAQRPRHETSWPLLSSWRPVRKDPAARRHSGGDLMNWLMLQHGYTTGHPLGLCLALALGLALGTQAALAKECQREIPLPTDVRLNAPGPDVPEAVARFAGVWS